MKRMLNLILFATVSVVAVGAAESPRLSKPVPTVLTYGHADDVPMPLQTDGPDIAFLDWDADGDLDLVTDTNNGEMLLHRNIGTAQVPRFANVFREEIVLLNDKRFGRFFAPMRHSGLAAAEHEPRAVIAFGKHASIGEIGRASLPLNLFVPRGLGGDLRWDVFPAHWPDGTPLRAFADTWMSPTVATVDWDGDGRSDLLVGAWHPGLAQPQGGYTAGFNHPDSSWNPMAGRVYLLRNVSVADQLRFEPPVPVTADGGPLSTYGFVYPEVHDIDGDGRFDLLVGEQRPGLRWYRNVGSREHPAFVAAGRLQDEKGAPIESVLALRGRFADLDADGTPEFVGLSYFAFSAGLWRFDQTTPQDGDLSRDWRSADYLPMQGGADTPVTGQGICTMEVTDWNGDGVRDLLLGAEPGTPMILINRGTNAAPVWAAPTRLRFVDGSPLEYYGIEVGRGSVWGPIEFYLERTLPRLADWDGDGTEDMLTGSMGMRLLWLRGHRIEGELRFERPQALTLDGRPIDAAHRVQPVVRDFDGDGHPDILALDAENVVTLWHGHGDAAVTAPERMRGPEDAPLQLNPSLLGVTSGRRGLAMVDWDLDGAQDLISYDSFGAKVGGGAVRLRRGDPAQPGRFLAPVDLFPIISHHTGGVTLVDWDEDGFIDILTGGDHMHLRIGSQPRGQLFLVNGRDVAVPPARR